MRLEPNGRAPYTSASAAVTALDAFRDRAPSGPVDTDMLIKLGVPESIAKRTLNSLMELGLVEDNGKPTELLEAFKQVKGQDEYQARLQEWIRAVYADVLPYGNPEVDSIDKIQEAFRGYEPEGQRKAMASLLVGLWEYAGLPVPKEQATAAKQSKPRTTARSQQKRRSGGSTSKVAPTPIMADVSPALVGMVQSIPTSWTADKRAAFLVAFTATLDYAVAVVDEEPGSSLSDEQEVSP